MTLPELFTLRESIESRVNQYWTFWSISIFAVCGWLFSQPNLQLGMRNSVFIALALLIFFIANLSVLVNSTKLSLLVHDEICIKAGESSLSKNFKKKLPAGRVQGRLELTIIMHLVIDIALISLVLLKAL